MKKYFLFLMIICAASVSVYSQRVLGGYQSAATDDEGVTSAADFAVQKKSEDSDMAILLEAVVKAETQTVAGVNYRLCLRVYSNNDEGEKGDSFTVQTIVFRNLQGEFSLKSWANADCAPKDDSD